MFQIYTHIPNIIDTVHVGGVFVSCKGEWGSVRTTVLATRSAVRQKHGVVERQDGFVGGEGDVAGVVMSDGDDRVVAGADFRDVYAGDAVDFHGGDLEGIDHGAVARGRGGHGVDAGLGDGDVARGFVRVPEVGDGLAGGERGGGVGAEEDGGAVRGGSLYRDGLQGRAGAAGRGSHGHGIFRGLCRCHSDGCGGVAGTPMIGWKIGEAAHGTDTARVGFVRIVHATRVPVALHKIQFPGLFGDVFRTAPIIGAQWDGASSIDQC